MSSSLSSSSSPSKSERLLRDVLTNSAPPSPSRQHRRRHSTPVPTRKGEDELRAPHEQVLRARLERVLCEQRPPHPTAYAAPEQYIDTAAIITTTTIHVCALLATALSETVLPPNTDRGPPTTTTTTALHAKVQCPDRLSPVSPHRWIRLLCCSRGSRRAPARPA
ncbi:uncharacterized protein BT62DRAFT_377858 [Guyanagaster necrorhizus]|uniref:Uncharacterized protein n=1 Tax=Guyanagaster necrorhizus TaxID=856835 RepID=A0A9P7VKX2_9AGAR|nr:uncharacterized protein BT62DRAFT_377858 [Guyanagaster necrorhizus MCA 3950]KAG7442599.1 hypothetical protein BT62DRAFT_377858 [Guyanagaster necrorhizus MCA 3950]